MLSHERRGCHDASYHASLNNYEHNSKTIYLMQCVCNDLNMFGDRKGTTKELCDKDFAERSGKLSGAVCLKTLVLLGNDPMDLSNCSEQHLGVETPGPSPQKTTCSFSYRFRGSSGISALYQGLRVPTPRRCSEQFDGFVSPFWLLKFVQNQKGSEKLGVTPKVLQNLWGSV